MSTKVRSYNWDYLRFLASVAVVVLHVSYSYMGAIPVEGTSFLTMAVYNAPTRFAVPVFFMLSGLFLLDPAKEMTIMDCIKRTGKLFVFFYFWSAFYAFQGLAVDVITGEVVTQEMITNSLQRFIVGHGHMWFMFRLAGYYLMLPFARAISANKTALNWFCGFWMVHRFVLPFMSKFLPMDYINMWMNQFDFQFMISYFGYFFLGYWIKVTDIPAKLRAVIYVLGGISIGAIGFCTVWDSRKQGALTESWLNPSGFFPFVFAISMFVFFKHYDVSGKDRRNAIIHKLSRYSLIIYVLHPFFIEKMNMLGINTLRFNPIWSVPVFSGLIVIACIGVAWVVYKLPLKIARL